MSNTAKDHIFIVDDSEATIDMLVEILGDSYDLSVATDGESALEAIRQFPPELILLDIMMPGMDGYEVCRELKKSQDTEALPIIFVTAKNEIRDEVFGFELGSVDYITKPFDPNVVLARVRTHLELARSRKLLFQKNIELTEAAVIREEMEIMARHDLKNPLTSIAMGIELLLLDKTITSTQRSSLQNILEAAQKVSLMLNSSLDIFKMERGLYNYSPETVSLSKIVASLQNDYKKLLDEKNLSVFVDDQRDFTVTGESLLCYSMLANLLQNAIDASPEEEIVFIFFLSHDEHNEIKIKNRGAVPEEIRSIFFEKFVTQGKKNGSGLGTYSAKLMANTMGGTVSMEVVEDDYTVVSVSLPV